MPLLQPRMKNCGHIAMSLRTSLSIEHLGNDHGAGAAQKARGGVGVKPHSTEQRQR